MAAYKCTAQPALEPVSVAEAKNWIRKDLDLNDEDQLIAGLIESARQLCETYTNRKFITQTWEMVIDAFPGYTDPRAVASQAIRTPNTGAWFWMGTMWGIALPFGPAQSVSSFTYKNPQGGSQALTTPANYTPDLISTPPRIMPVWSTIWPMTQYVPNAVSINFVAGYGPAATDVPQSIRTAILMLMAYWYKNREAYALGQGNVTAMPMHVTSLLSQYRDVRY